jgi:glycosyltransferase involved in cell wall biosynthesis
LRALKFCRYLPDFGWMPTVLTVKPTVYERTDPRQLSDVPADVEILRAFSLDTRRHLSFRGGYPKILALPDRWSSWILAAVPAGLRAIKRKQIDVILSTYPTATAVMIGYILHRLTGKPWIVDFRDSMTEEGYPADPLTFRVYRWIERQAIRHASALLFTAPGAIRMYRQRYEDLDAERCVLLPNGYDEADFDGISLRSKPAPRLRLLHSGLVYPWERDPQPWFRALSKLKAEGKISQETLSVELRASGNEAEFQKDVDQLGIDDIVHFLPTLPYRASLQDATEADALVVLQGACCDHQVPAKVYEYLRLQKPILALTTHVGDTGSLLRDSGGATIIDMADETAIHEEFPEFLNRVRTGSHPVPALDKSRFYSRRSQTKRLSQHFDKIVGASQL